MNVLRWGSHMLARTTPTGLILTGAAIALTMPIVRRGLRATALLATKGVLTITDQAKGAIAKIKENAEDFVAEARTEENATSERIAENWDKIRHRAKRHRRRLIAATATGVVAMSEKANELKHEFHEAVDEVKNKRSQDHEPEKSRHHAETDVEPDPS